MSSRSLSRLRRAGLPTVTACRAAASRRGSTPALGAHGQDRLRLVEQLRRAAAVADRRDDRRERDQPVDEIERLPHSRRMKTPCSSSGSAFLPAPVRGQRDAARRVHLADLDGVEQPALAREVDRLRRQPHLLRAAPAQAGDQRQVGDRGDARRSTGRPAARASSSPSATARPGRGRRCSSGAQPSAQVSTGRHGESGPSSSADRVPCSSTADTSPQRERRAQHGRGSTRARRSRRGAGPSSSPPSSRTARDRGAHVVLARAQRQHPRLDEQQPRVGVEELRGEPHSQSSTDVVRPALA